MDLRKLDGFARMHLGLITRVSAAAVGVNRSAWYRAIRRGELQPVQPNVARISGQPSSRQQAVLAAVLSLASAGDNPAVVLASHRSAAFLLGLQRPATDPIDITVDSLHARELDGVIVHRTTRREDLTPTHRHRVPCTNELRTLVDLGAVDPDAVPEALEHFTVARRLTPTMVARLIDRHEGRPGVVPLRRALDDWPLGDTIPDSELEIAMAHLLERANLPPATFHADVAGYEVDFQIDGTPVVVECDGWTTHVARPDQWEFDLTPRRTNPRDRPRRTPPIPTPGRVRARGDGTPDPRPPRSPFTTPADPLIGCSGVRTPIGRRLVDPSQHLERIRQSIAPEGFRSSPGRRGRRRA